MDVLAAVDHAVSEGFADPHRLVVGGWSCASADRRKIGTKVRKSVARRGQVQQHVPCNQQPTVPHNTRGAHQFCTCLFHN
eukprot:SAG11_NODE_341_length_10462_cov_49.272990_14_plen_80_part_00